MRNYVEFTLLPNDEIPLYFLWEKLYQQLHLALVEIKDPNNKVSLGVSFPNYDAGLNQLGCKLRLFAPSSAGLEAVNINQWLSRLSDYVQITSIRNIPEKVDGNVFFKRNQPKSNNARLARRKAKRKNISIEQALIHFENRAEQTTKLPFINMKSHSSNTKFRLFIEKSGSENQVAGSFNSYGLSKTATVPCF